MSDQQNIPEDEALAAEYVLRLMGPEEERAFETRLLSEADLLARVQAWESEFAALADDVPDLAPPAKLKAALVAKLDPDSQKTRGSTRHWIFGWLAVPSMLALAVAAFFVVLPAFKGPAFDPVLHATLKSADGVVHIEAGYSPNGMLFKVIHEQGTPAQGRAYELWVIGDGGAPVSLGLVQLYTATVFEIDAEIAALLKGGALAVSDEPAGGSPTGAPTGAVLAIDEFFDI